MRLKKPIGYLTTLLFLAIISVASATNYVQTGYTSALYSQNYDTGMVFNYSGTCTLKLGARNTFISSSTFDSPANYYSPTTTLIATSLLEDISNTTCAAWGETSEKSISKSNRSFYESQMTWLQNAINGWVTTSSTYTCSPNVDTYTARFIVGNQSNSMGNCLYRFRRYENAGTVIGGDNRLLWISELISKYNNCGNTTMWKARRCDDTYVNGLFNRNATYQYIYPFNSSGGVVNYSFSSTTINEECPVGGADATRYTIDLVNLNKGTYTNINTQIGGACGITVNNPKTIPFSAVSGTLSLDQDTQYLWVITYVFWGGANYRALNINVSSLDMSISTYHPDWVCGDWSDCVNASQWRNCHDANGITTDKMETRTCYEIPYWSLDLGFESGYSAQASKCIHGWLCIPAIVNRSPDYPTSWTVVNSQYYDFLEMSTDDSTVGSKSLKMWYIPPMNFTYLAPTQTCGYNAIGNFPEINRGINNALFIEAPVTFPSPLMSVSFDIKKCASSVVQEEPYFLCGNKICYENYGSCSNKTPSGKFVFKIYDTNTSSTKFELYQDADIKWTPYTISTENLNLVPNRTYNLIFAVNPYDIYSPDAHCVYIDNVRVDVRTTTLTCESAYCEALDYYIPKIINNTCTFEIEKLSSKCVSTSVKDELENCSDFCIGTTYYDLKLVQGGCKQVSALENAEQCVEIEEQLSQEEMMSQPIPIIKDTVESLVGEGYLEQQNIGWILFFTSPYFLLLIIAIAIAGYVTVKIPTGHGAVFGVVVFMVILSVYAIVGLFPIWFILIEIVLAGFLVAKFLMAGREGGSE